MKTLLVLSLLLLISLPAVFASGAKEEPKKDDSMKKEDTKMMEKDSSMEKKDAMKLPDEKGFYSTQNLQPRVIPFTTEAAAAALAKNGSVVYFFAATWCPTCQAAMKDIERNYGKIPAKVTLVLVNYDTQQALKKKYGIATQHTFVQINAKGEKVAVWAGSPTVDDILKRIVTM